MSLLIAGYWVTTYWAGSYWHDQYWPKYGEEGVPITPVFLPAGYQIPKYWAGSYWHGSPSYWAAYGTALPTKRRGRRKFPPTEPIRDIYLIDEEEVIMALVQFFLKEIA